MLEKEGAEVRLGPGVVDGIGGGVEGVLSRVGGGLVVLLDQVLELLSVQVAGRRDVVILCARKASEGSSLVRRVPGSAYLEPALEVRLSPVVIGSVCESQGVSGARPNSFSLPSRPPPGDSLWEATAPAARSRAMARLGLILEVAVVLGVLWVSCRRRTVEAASISSPVEMTHAGLNGSWNSIGLTVKRLSTC